MLEQSFTSVRPGAYLRLLSLRERNPWGATGSGRMSPVCRAPGQGTCVAGSRTPQPLRPGDAKPWVPSSVLLTSIRSFSAAVPGNPPSLLVGPRKFNAQNRPLVKGTTWGPVASEGCTGHGTRGSAASQWLDPTRVAARVVQTPRRPAGFCVMTAPFVSQQEVGTEGGGHRPRLLAVHGPHGPRLAIREVGGTGRMWNFGSHHVALKEVVQNVACLAVRMADQPLDPHGPPSPCSASEVHTKGHPRE